MTACTSANEEAQALYEQGKMLRTQGDQVTAMSVFIRAAHSGTTDEVLLGRVWSNMANMCRQANEHETAYRAYSVSAAHFAASGDSLAYAYALNNMAWEQAVSGHKDSALAWVDSAVTYYPHPPLTGKVRESRAAACLFAGEYDSVLLYSAPPANDYLLMLRAQAYAWLQQDDSATYYAQLLLPRTSNPFYLDDIYYILTHNDPAADKEQICALSSMRADVQKEIEARHVRLAQAVELLQKEMQSERQNTQWYILLCLIGCIGGTILYGWYRRKKKQSEQQSVRRNIQALCQASDLRQQLAWDDYAAFCCRSDELFNGLAGRLQSKGLNEQDIRICVLTLIGLSHYKTANLLNCSPKSVGKLKDLTAHKLGVSGGQLQDRLIKG